MTVKIAATAIYAALIAAETAAKELPDSPEKVTLTGKLAELHSTLNDLRKLLGMGAEEFADFIGVSYAAFIGGSGGKDD